MTRRSTLPWVCGLVGAILTVTLSSAQPPRGSNRTQEDPIGPADIKRVGDWLKGMGGDSGYDPKLLAQALEFLKNNPQFGQDLLKQNPKLQQQIRDFNKQNPNADPSQKLEFAKELLQKPEVSNPKTLGDLKQLAERMGSLPPGSGGYVPSMPIPKIGGDVPQLPKMPSTQPGTMPPPTGPPAATNPPRIAPSGQPSVSANEGAPRPMEQSLPPAGSGGGVGNRTPGTAGQPFGRATQGGASSLPSGISSGDQEQYQRMAGWWEKNVGPLQESPAIRQLMVDFAKGSSDRQGSSGLNEILGGKSGDSPLGKLGDTPAGSSNWKFPELGLGKTDFGWGNPPSASDFNAPSIGDGPSGSLGDIGTGNASSWLPVIILGVAAASGLLLWWLWPRLFGRSSDEPRPIFGLGPWPVDPRTIADRAALVKAFEYLSVLRCGVGAKVWNHVTIASELRRVVPGVGDLAEPLARLYAVARYTPAEEPLEPADIAEARRHLCQLAGVNVA